MLSRRPGRNGTINDRRHTILIVDDEPNVRLVFRTALDLFGDTVVEAGDGEAALEWLAESRADLVLLDLLMPGIGGMQVLQRLRDQGNSVPVVITAYGRYPRPTGTRMPQSSPFGRNEERAMNSDMGLILIVDDEPNVRLVFRTALESAGYRVDEANDGEMALDRLRKAPVALILLDLRMPGSSGMETLRRLRDAGNDVPVVIITAQGSIPDAVEAMKLGAIDFLTKPIKPEALRRVVDDLVRRRTAPESEPEPVLTPSRRTAATVVTLAPAAVDLAPTKRALNRREFDRALGLLEEALELDADSAEAHNLMGVLRESLGQPHAAYHAYRRALEADPCCGPALDNMRRYCERYGLDFSNWSINPGAE